MFDKEEHFVTDLPQGAFKSTKKTSYRTSRSFVVKTFRIARDLGGQQRQHARQATAGQHGGRQFRQSLNPKDEVFIVNFNDEAFLDSDFTSDVLRLQDALQRIDSTRARHALYDATGMSLDHLKEKAKWDKQVLLIVTDGEDNASILELEGLVRRLQETDTVIYAVGLLSEEDRGSAKRATRAVRHLARTTGGTAFFPKSVGGGERDHPADRPRHSYQYILAYSPLGEALPASARSKSFSPARRRGV